LTGLGAGQDGGGRVKPDGVPDLAEYPLGIGVGQVDLVDHRDDLQVVLQGQVAVGKGLGFHSLGGVHDQERPLAGRQAAGHLVRKVHVPRGID